MSGKPRDKAEDERDERRLREADQRRARCHRCGYLICSCNDKSEKKKKDTK